MPRRKRWHGYLGTAEMWPQSGDFIEAANSSSSPMSSLFRGQRRERIVPGRAVRTRFVPHRVRRCTGTGARGRTRLRVFVEGKPSSRPTAVKLKRLSATPRRTTAVSQEEGRFRCWPARRAGMGHHRVADPGRASGPRTPERIFDAFHQAARVAPALQGSRARLALSKKARGGMRRHHIRLSRIGEGRTFRGELQPVETPGAEHCG